uniref:Uncharacterized protein n=1 Tax=Oryza rufipogon TaxID=4529 RepID=A0A0E0PD16_ORYRU
MRADATFRRRPVARAVAQLGTTLPHRPRRPAAPPAPSRIAPPSAARTHPREDKVFGGSNMDKLWGCSYTAVH